MDKLDKSSIRGIGIAVILAVFFFFMLTEVKLPLAKVIWMQEGQSVNVQNVYGGKSMITSIKLIDIAGAGNRTKLCGFLIDGDPLWIEEGNDRELKGVRVYVREIISVRDQLQDKDVCKVLFTRPIIKINESAKQEEINASESKAISSVNISKANVSAAEERPNITVTKEIINESVAAVEEKPSRISIFDALMIWIKSLF